jgi:Tfp pilus assembly protein PilN
VRPVNLLPPEERQRARLRLSGAPAAIVVGAVVGLVLVALVGLMLNRSAGSAADDQDRAEAEAARLEREVSAPDPDERRLAGLEERRGAVAALAGARLRWDRVLGDLAAAAPAEVWLTSLVGDPPAAGAAASVPPPAPGGTAPTPSGLHLEGFALSRAQVAEFARRVESVHGVGVPAVSETTTEARGGQDVVRFVMDAPLNMGALDRPGAAVPLDGGTP